jgi:acetyl esterase/lipase
VTVDQRLELRCHCGWFFVTKSLAIWLLVASTTTAAVSIPRLSLAKNLVLAGLSDDPSAASGAAETPAPVAPPQAASLCPAGVTFTRGLKYAGEDRNVLDVATAQIKPDARRPILVFIAGNDFSSERDSTVPDPLVEKVMCFAASNGLVAAHVFYRLAPAATWPAGARDVAAAISWVFENADLFGGNAQEIIPIGYGAGAFHLATFLSHKEFQDSDDFIAGAALVSGIYEPTKDTDESERAYLGADASTYGARSAVHGLTEIEEPLVLAWSSADAPRFVIQGERLRKTLCDAGHCPRTAVFGKPSSLASVFDLDGTSANLHERLRQLIGQLDARGLP